MRELTVNEIIRMEQHGCWAEDWSDIMVDESFEPSSISNVNFYGHVEVGNLNGTIEVEEGFVRRCTIRNATLRSVIIGDGCLIENIRGYISNIQIGDRCFIADAGSITAQEGATFGQGIQIAVMNEGGNENVVLYPGLTSQMAALQMRCPEVFRLAAKLPAAAVSTIGAGSRIIGVKEITNAIIGEGTQIQGATRISNCTIESTDDASTYIGSDAIIVSSIVAPGASITDGAKIFDCFVGESVHVGKGFSAEASLFFANTYMDNGESCAAFCGPFSTSHHKSTLLIGGMFSFYNAGSGTNQSNHAYKMGPIHYGTLERGAKTASGSHILWPAHIGSFSMVMGKLTIHPNLRKLPFSYIMAGTDCTYIVPGINIKTVGTWRDVGKWPKRDLRPRSSRRDLVNFAFPNPYIIQDVLEGKEILQRLIKSSQDEILEYHGCLIRRNAAVKGISYYNMVIRLFLYEYFQTNDTCDNHEQQNGHWVDLAGMLAPKVEIDCVTADVKAGRITDITELESILQQIHANYRSYMRQYAIFVMQHEADSMFIDQDYWMAEASAAHEQWLKLVREDAEHEYQLGDVSEEQLRKFLASIK